MKEEDVSESIKALIKKAEAADKSEDALRFSQAACNSANALRAFTGPKPMQ